MNQPRVLDNVISRHHTPSTSDTNWLCIENVYEKLCLPKFYDLGRTKQSTDELDYSFFFSTENVGFMNLLHIFCMNSKSVYSLSICNSSILKLDTKRDVLFLSQVMKRFVLNNERSKQNYLTTYSFREEDMALLKNKSLYISVSLNDKNDFSQSIGLYVDFRHLLNDPASSNFVIESEDGVKFHVHKEILANYSDVFGAMFKQNMTESLTNYVKLVSVDSEDLQHLLDFLYSGKLSSFKESVLVNLLLLANKYNIKELRDICESAISLAVNEENVFDMLNLADLCNCDLLKTAVYRFINKHKNAIFKSDSFRDVKNLDLIKQMVSNINF